MREKPVRILVVADDPDDIQFLEGAFQEINDYRFSRGCMLQCRPEYAIDCAETEEMLRRDTFDAVLLDLALSDHGGLPAFAAIRMEAPLTPVILLASQDDETLSITLVRQGADDYLIKQDLDCVPLARAISCAIERNRHQMARQAVILVDGLTGLYNEHGLIHLGERHWKLAARLSLQVLVVIVQVGGLSQLRAVMGQQENEMAALEVAEVMRAAFDETDLLARIGPERFAAVAVVAGVDERLQRLAHARCSIERLSTVRIASVFASPLPESDLAGSNLETLLNQAGQALCENRLVARSA